ncbi:MAG: hypothetical protein A3F47_00370 [Candidatus Staskawiczbacteria bacterium RIFCSPHIGHO2_12_FULL_38_11]|uniref:IrrE N-terminal-like domain-containing protein n=1 Tax=Candidatus Staskawiczbacteria bacterium RIFCSPHIGHO2_12_FULL_38_11 TaxID=1802209 RepID=A0A1G2I4D3_9BACT|nr:MAG: hypothetical protein A3F47_00370 [Candidatus Staskawiczbacteria bacterium RIFCSPHIGHO2_12_FULL_38_11]
MKISLAQKFPQLDFAKNADEWLGSLKEKTILEQLHERKVARVVISNRVCHFNIHALGSFARIGENFYIKIKDGQSTKEKIFTLGHEIAHTFEIEDNLYYEILEFPHFAPNDFPKFLKDMIEEIYKLIESFCDQFAKKWMEINGQEKVCLFFRNFQKEDSFSFIQIMEPS